ncbi:hypothetical protein IEO21_10303 [Rhodonia placenta]|uniref:Uncharacterized protein n=1 Tax=Rhodonia placenta TaxID=104341 RepID=A0A8H7NSP4_9APHY|nr:hypothetical protein IEO21_10303 [Postia placenta]
MSSQFLYTSNYGNTSDAFNRVNNSALLGPTTERIIYPPPHYGDMSHYHQASGDGNALYVDNGPCAHMSCSGYRALLADMRETSLSEIVLPGASGFERGAGVTFDGAPTSHLVSSDSVQATIPPGLFMDDGPGSSQHSEPDPFPHIDPYILDLIVMESRIDGLNRASWRYTPSRQDINSTKQTNGASEDATEPEGHACLLADSSTAPAYRLAQPRKSAKARENSISIEIALSPREEWDEPPAFAVDRSGPGLWRAFILLTPVKLRRDDVVLYCIFQTSSVAVMDSGA